MPGDLPKYRLIRRNEKTKKWDSIGAAWPREDGSFSVSIELVRGGEKIKALMVENKPRAAGDNTAPRTPTPKTQESSASIDDEILF